jgi:hypothetical protein
MPSNIRSYPTVWIYLLLFLMAFQAFGWLMILQGVQWHVKNQAECLVSRETTPIKTCTIPLQLFENIRVGRREVRLEGQLFDIKSITPLQDSVRLELYHDQTEEKLIRHWESLWAGHSSDHTSAQHPDFWLAKWLGSAFIPSLQDDFKLIAVPVCATAVYHWQPCTAQTAPGVLSPPPKA